ncbi:MAG: 8-oxo-dGTP diphosphatase [Clostridia bacterium]|nr:8-oxo-dGTP diphosphatase [Clostridia bacterium]
MDRTERVELTVLCLIRDGDRYLLQDRAKGDWTGYTLPGGHVEPGESIVDAVVREMKEETGLDVRSPRLCGVKQFPIEGGRYVVFLFTADRFSGELESSDEGKMHWFHKNDLDKLNLVDDFMELLDVMTRDDLNEFQYVRDGDAWSAIIK